MDCTGRITEVREDGVMVIEAPCPSFEELTRKKVETVRIELLDGRPLSGEQRRMCYALIREIADWMGEEPEAAMRHAQEVGLAFLREIPRVRNGLGTVVLTTPKGIMSGRQAAKENVGGEILCYVW